MALPLVAVGAALAGQALLTGLGTAIGAAAAQGNFEEAKRLQAQAMAELQKLDPQSLARVRAEMGESAFRNLIEPPEGRAAQMRALQRLEAMSTGESPEDAAAYARAQAEAAAQERGVRMAALQRLAQRGAGATSGLALAGQMEAAQQSTQLAAMRGLETAAESRRRALQAAQALGGMAGELRGADFRAAAERARAQDIINQFNAQQRLRQAESVYGAEARKAEGMAGALRGQAQREEEEAARRIAMGAEAGKGIGGIGVGLASQYGSK